DGLESQAAVRRYRVQLLEEQVRNQGQFGLRDRSERHQPAGQGALLMEGELLRAEQLLLSGQGHRINDARRNGSQHDDGTGHHHRDSPPLVPKVEAYTQQYKPQLQKPQHQVQLINRTHLFPYWSSGPRLPDGSIAIHVNRLPSRCQGKPAGPYCNPFIPLSSPARAEGSIAWPLSLREPPA